MSDSVGRDPGLASPARVTAWSGAVMRQVAILGATGSIGASALDVIARHPDRFRASVLSAHRNVTALADLCARHRPDLAVIADPGCKDSLARALHERGVRVRSGCRPRSPDCRGIGSRLRHGHRRHRRRRRAGIDPGRGQQPASACCWPTRKPWSWPGRCCGRRSNRAAARLSRSIPNTMPCSSACHRPHRDLEAAGVRRLLLTASGGPFRGQSRAQLADGHAGAGLRPSELGDGAQDLGRLGHADEQGPGSDRGAGAVRRTDRRHRGGRAPAKHGSFAGRICRWLAPGATRQPRHAHRPGPRPGLARARRSRGRTAGSGKHRPSRFRGTGHRYLPLPAAGVAGPARGRRRRPRC